MGRQKPEYSQTTWQDVAVNVEEWELTYGIRIEARITWQTKLTAMGCVEVVIMEGNTIGRGSELVRVREAFPARKMTGQPGAVLWAVSCALRALEAEPWLWSAKMRRQAAKEA